MRILDAGGWTDTWFAGRGTVCPLAVGPGTEVSARVHASRAPGHVDLTVGAFGERYRFGVEALPGRHPLLEAAIRRWADPEWQLEVTVASAVPPGSGLGTSASVTVATIAALQSLAGERGDPATIARDAHRVETIDLALQSGVQDQIAAACGGASVIDVDPYPQFAVRALDLAPATWEALGARVVTVYLGAPHRSSAVHEQVIARLATAGGDALLEPLRLAATEAAEALAAGDVDAYGAAMTANTAAQERLHPSLISGPARAVFETAVRFGAAGWKVNGAGGEGGSVSIVGPDDPAALRQAIEALPGVVVLPLRPEPLGVHIVDRA